MLLILKDAGGDVYSRQIEIQANAPSPLLLQSSMPKGEAYFRDDLWYYVDIHTNW